MDSEIFFIIPVDWERCCLFFVTSHLRSYASKNQTIKGRTVAAVIILTTCAEYLCRKQHKFTVVLPSQ